MVFSFFACCTNLHLPLLAWQIICWDNFASKEGWKFTWLLISLSIKDAERNKRSNQRGMAYQITGPEQKRPSNWLQALRGYQFKEASVTFLVDYLENDNSARILGSKKLIINNGDTCYSFVSQEDRMVNSEEVAYYAKDDEADTRMIYHVGQLPSGTNVVVRMWLWLPWDASINYKIKWFGWSLIFSPKTTLDTSALINYLTNLESHSAKQCHSIMPSLGAIKHLRSAEKGG